MEIVLIAAVSANRVIGSNGEIPWHYPEDLQHFKETTMGSPMILGRKTFDGFPSPLPGREHVVLSRSEQSYESDRVHHATDTDKALDIARQFADTSVYIAGGEQVYREYIDIADKMVLTRIHDMYDGDTYFPDWNSNNWGEVERRQHDDFDYVTYERIDRA